MLRSVFHYDKKIQQVHSYKNKILNEEDDFSSGLEIITLGSNSSYFELKTKSINKNFAKIESTKLFLGNCQATGNSI